MTTRREGVIWLGAAATAPWQRVLAASHFGTSRCAREFFEQQKRAGISAPGEVADVFNFVPEYNEPRRILRLADDLACRGWKSARVEKIWGATFARLFGSIWPA